MTHDQQQQHVLPFGKHKGTPLPDVPTGYLAWLLREAKLSSGLRAAVAGELASRGLAAPPPAPPRPIPPCRHCGAADPFAYWLEDSLGRRRIRVDCRRCHKLVDYPPCVPPYTDMADANASAAPALDALIRLEELGVVLVSDGVRVRYQGDGWKRVPPDLNAVVRSCGHQLARLLGDTRTPPPSPSPVVGDGPQGRR